MTKSTAQRNHNAPPRKAESVIGLSAAATVLLVSNAAFASPVASPLMGLTLTADTTPLVIATHTHTQEGFRTED